jgi:CBS domain containing-hemolysin-like protein
VNPTIFCYLALAGLLVTFLAAVGAKSLSKFSPRQLDAICRRRKAANRLGEVLRHDQQAALAAETLLVLAVALFVFAGTFWIWLESSAAGVVNWRPLLSGLAGGAIGLLAMTVWIPWAVARLWAAGFVYYTWPFWRVVAWVLLPLVLVARFVDTVLHRLAGRLPEEPDEESFEDEIRTIVTEGHREGLLEEDAREMIEGVIELGDVDVSEIMTPRTDMVSLPISRSWDEMIQFAIQAEHTRIPVFSKTRDDIVGILHIKDLLPEMAKPPADRVAPWSKLLREPYFVPETKPVDVLLQEFQRTRHHIAIVLDEYGGVSGLVSMEDVLEEIVGEIGDEYDEELVEGIKELEDGAFEALGRVHIDEINERLALDLPDDRDFDTIGGFVFSELGHIPARGEQLVYHNARITVVDATSRRIERLRIEIIERTSHQAV